MKACPWCSNVHSVAPVSMEAQWTPLTFAIFNQRKLFSRVYLCLNFSRLLLVYAFYFHSFSAPGCGFLKRQCNCLNHTLHMERDRRWMVKNIGCFQEELDTYLKYKDRAFMRHWSWILGCLTFTEVCAHVRAFVCVLGEFTRSVEWKAVYFCNEIWFINAFYT